MWRATAVAFLFLLLLAVPGCLFAGGGTVEEPLEEDIGKAGFQVRKSDFHHDYEMTRDTKRDEIPWTNGKGVATMEVVAEITEGRETVQVVDAAGKVLWEKTFSSGEAYVVEPAGSGERGEWKIVMIREGVTGHVRVHAFQRAAP